MAEIGNKFDIVAINDYLEQSLFEIDDVLLDFYLKSYLEINKFFSSLGTIFGFVSSDLLQKVQILQNYLDDPEICDNFKSVRCMMEYEKAAGLLTPGSRTLLPLHRGLNFFKTFLEKLLPLQDSDSTSGECRSAYNDTLAQYHPFAVRFAAKLAMYTLPTRGDLFKRVCRDEEQVSISIALMPKLIAEITNVYDRIENLYTQYGLHSIA